jgi:hypothetical protein
LPISSSRDIIEIFVHAMDASASFLRASIAGAWVASRTKKYCTLYTENHRGSLLHRDPPSCSCRTMKTAPAAGVRQRLLVSKKAEILGVDGQPASACNRY